MKLEEAKRGQIIQGPSGQRYKILSVDNEPHHGRPRVRAYPEYPQRKNQRDSNVTFLHRDLLERFIIVKQPEDSRLHAGEEDENGPREPIESSGGGGDPRGGSEPEARGGHGPN